MAMIETSTYKFVWVDEDGEQVSPIHEKFGSALNFVSGWHTSYNRLVQRFGGRPEDIFDHQLKSLTRSGKPPVRLRRIKTTTVFDELTERQQLAVSAVLGDEVE